MTHVPTGQPGDRARRIEMVAAIVFGRDPNDPARALPGWQSKLSIAMGMGRTAVNDTLDLAVSDKFDRRLRGFIAGHRFQMAEDIHTLETLERIFGATDAQRADYHRYSDAWEGDTDD